MKVLKNVFSLFNIDRVVVGTALVEGVMFVLMVTMTPTPLTSP